MLVVLLVALDAGAAQLVLVQVAGVAVGALGGAMFAPQRVLRVGVVVEGRRLPALGAVAGLALLAISALVALGAVVVLLVAGVTRERRVLVVRALLVAVGALGVDVFAGQRELRLVVIELGFFPAVLGMAVHALGPERALVHVVLLVTGIAVLWRLPVLLLRFVALFALDLGVFAAQGIVGLGVVELVLVEIDDARVAALVVGVATLAGCRLLAAVEAGALTHVLPHFLVAIHAQPILRRAVELDMALGAFLFPLCVPLNQLARA